MTTPVVGCDGNRTESDPVFWCSEGEGSEK